MTVWFDVDDLLNYFRVGNKRISGIQRLCFEIFRAAVSLQGADIRFVRFGGRGVPLVPVAWTDLLAVFEGNDPQDPAPPAPTPSKAGGPEPVVSTGPKSLSRRVAKRAADQLPPLLRRTLVPAAIMQIQVVVALAVFLAHAAALLARRAVAGGRWMAAKARRRPLPPPPGGASFDEIAKPGDALLVFGAPWNRERYSDIARWVRDEKRMRFGVLMHDLVPIRHPEWCHRGVPKSFREWYDDVLPFCDVVFANSRHTAEDVSAYARETGLVLNRQPDVLPIGAGFGAADGVMRSSRLPAAGSYVLFVSTLEARKNHALLVRVWSLLLAEVEAGTRAAESLPDLVFAGGVGWLVADVIGQLEASAWLGGRVRLIRTPTDSELRALYEGCLFTLFPSLFEGWGLPVTESLSFGKPCLVSNAASLPEAGGALCRYFDPESVRSAYAAVADVLDDRTGLARWEAEVRSSFRPIRWEQTARAVVTTLSALDGTIEP